MSAGESESSDLMRALRAGFPGARVAGPAEATANLILLQLGRERREYVRVLCTHGQIAINDVSGNAVSFDPTVEIAGEEFLSELRTLANAVFQALCVICGLPHHHQSSSSIVGLKFGVQHTVVRATLVANRDRQELTLRFTYGSRWKCCVYQLLARIQAWFRRAGSHQDM